MEKPSQILQLPTCQLLFGLIALLLLSGCNLFSSMHSDGHESNATVLVADGKSALGRGDFANAVEYFRLAMENNPRDSDARVGYAEARLKAQGYNFSTLMSIVTNSQNKNSGNSGNNNNNGNNNNSNNFAVPTDWGCKDLTEMFTLVNTMVNTLDPITQGKTDGPYAANNVNVNICVGFFYLMRAAVRAQQVAASFQVQEISKSSTSAAVLGIPQVLFDQLPDNFYWLTNNPPTSLLNQLQSDMNIGIARMRVAAANSNSQKMINDMINSLNSLQIQTQ